jgi:hypothetical protein
MNFLDYKPKPEVTLHTNGVYIIDYLHAGGF